MVDVKWHLLNRWLSRKDDVLLVGVGKCPSICHVISMPRCLSCCVLVTSVCHTESLPWHLFFWLSHIHSLFLITHWFLVGEIPLWVIFLLLGPAPRSAFPTLHQLEKRMWQELGQWAAPPGFRALRGSERNVWYAVQTLGDLVIYKKYTYSGH